ncbi:MAG: endolytic transglycosylase MltG [Eubacteriales bacterium]
MIITDSNKNNENFGETKTFRVQSHSAEGLKHQINSANENELSGKNRLSQAKSGAASNPQNAPNSANGGSGVRRTQGVNAQNAGQTGDAVICPPRRDTGNQNVRAVNTNTAQNSRRAAENRQTEQKPVPVKKSASVVPYDKTPVKKPAEKNSGSSMMKTISTDVHKNTSVRPANNPAQKNQETKNKSSGSGEGGNTVVSVVKAIVYIIFVIVISAFLAVAIIFVGNDVYAFVKSDEVVEITIPEYATLDEVSQILYENDIIKYPQVFKLYAVSKKDDGEFLAGTYSVSPMMNYDTLLGEFKEKIVYAVVDVTIPEGYTTDEIIDLFVDGYGIGTREGFVDVIQNHDFDYWFIDELVESGRMKDRIYRLDGYLFPDTYQFYTSSSEVTVIDKLLKRFSQIFTKEYRNQCAELGYSVDEMITLASMIEKEAGSPSEFFRVSSVFHNRLNNPWAYSKLESDATVLYVLRHESGEKLTLTADDLRYDTPYNTYIYEGLPPGPIANPSASAMLASLSPESTNYYYFVANKGQTYFSETKAQHDAYIAQFREDVVEQPTVGDVP